MYGTVLTVPGLMSGDSRTEPMRPPPGPVFPGRGTLGWEGPSPEFSPQQAAVPLPSSKVITISPPSR